MHNSMIQSVWLENIPFVYKMSFVNSWAATLKLKELLFI